MTETREIANKVYSYYKEIVKPEDNAGNLAITAIQTLIVFTEVSARDLINAINNYFHETRDREAKYRMGAKKFFSNCHPGFEHYLPANFILPQEQDPGPPKATAEPPKQEPIVSSEASQAYLQKIKGKLRGSMA